jgi:hypothetical protein
LCAFILCVGRGFATASSPVQGALPTEKAAKVHRPVEPLIDIKYA